MKKEAPESPALPGATYRLLTSIALLGTELCATRHVSKIAESLREIRPDLPHASSVLGFNTYTSGSFAEGLRMLEESVEKFPDYQMGKALWAVCLAQSQAPGWQQLLESVIDDGRDEYAVGLACDILGRDNPHAIGSTKSFAVELPANAVWA